MIVFSGQNFSKLYYEMLEYVLSEDILLSTSRIGNVKDIGSAYFEISDDDLRLVYLNKRAINPFFALAEFSWIISGSNSLKTLQYFIKNYDQYSDDGNTLNGAYGFRLKKYFGIDQISKSIDILKKKLIQEGLCFLFGQ